MNQGNSSTATTVEVLAELTTRLAAITLEQFIAPEYTCKKKDHIVVIASDTLKRLYTLRKMLVHEAETLSKIGIGLAAKCMDELSKKSKDAIRKELATPESPLLQNQAEMEKLAGQVEALKSLANVVNEIFWLDARRQNPELTTKHHIGISKDWGLFWCEDEDNDDFGIRIKIFSGAPLADALSEMLDRTSTRQ